MASFALRGTARELTWNCLVALTPMAAGIPYINTNTNYGNDHIDQNLQMEEVFID